MLSVMVAIVARCTILVGLALILGPILARVPQSRVCRLIFWFVLCVLLNVVIDYVNVWTLSYHKMDRIETFVLALLVAIWATFWPAATAQLKYSMTGLYAREKRHRLPLVGESGDITQISVAGERGVSWHTCHRLRPHWDAL